MSAIIGKLSFDPQEPLVRAVLERMLDASTREPHAVRDVFAAPGIALGACSSNGTERRATVGATEDESVRVVADAALLNAGQVRAELERRGHGFRGTTDSEVIAHAWQEWGPRTWDRLRGPFACAVWEERSRRLLLVRDHVGIRPLYFALLPNHGLVFASELRALLQDPGVGRHYCPEAIDAYLTLGYVPAPLTAYRRVSKLEPAHLLVVDGRRFHVQRYWDLPIAGREHDDRPDLAATLRGAVRRQAKGTGTSARLYSGGTPSTALLAASPHAGALIIDVEQDPTELTRSSAAARHLGASVQIESAGPQLAPLVTALAPHFDEPIADPAAVTQYAICAAARRHTEYALTAHGAAGLWAGYARHRVERLEMAVRAWLRGPLTTVGAGLARSLQESVRGARALAHLALPPGGACASKHAYGLWDEEHRRALYTRGFAWQVRESNPFCRHLELYASRESDDALDRALYVDAHTFLPDSTLAVADRAAAAAGLQLRFPFLDREMVELAARTPSAMKQRGRAGMYALRRLLLSRLPRTLMPAAAPQPAPHVWLRSALAALVPAMLLRPRFDGRGIVSLPVLAQLWEEHCSGRHDHSHRLWALLMLEFWFREHIDGDAAAEPLEYAVLKVA